jgi:hypothetical protein
VKALTCRRWRGEGPCGDSAGGDEVSAYERVCDLLVWTGEIDDAREMAQLVIDEFWETLSVMHGRTVEATTILRGGANEADQGFK